MTGKRLYLEALGWDFEDYRAKHWRRPNNSASKRWSKKVRTKLKREIKIDDGYE